MKTTLRVTPRGFDAGLFSGVVVGDGVAISAAHLDRAANDIPSTAPVRLVARGNVVERNHSNLLRTLSQTRVSDSRREGTYQQRKSRAVSTRNISLDRKSA